MPGLTIFADGHIPIRLQSQRERRGQGNCARETPTRSRVCMRIVFCRNPDIGSSTSTVCPSFFNTGLMALHPKPSILHMKIHSIPTLKNQPWWHPYSGSLICGFRAASRMTKPATFLVRCLAMAGSSLLAVSSASAQSTLYWDGGVANIGTNGNGASAGGAGTWNTTIQNWDDGVAPHVAWDNGSPFDTAVFAGAAGTVTFGSSINADTININTAGYLLYLQGGQTLAVNNINASGGGTSYIRGNSSTLNSHIVDNGGNTLAVTTAASNDVFSFAMIGSTNSTSITMNGAGADHRLRPGLCQLPAHGEQQHRRHKHLRRQHCFVRQYHC